MNHVLLVSYIACFSAGFPLSITLIYRDARPKRTNGMNWIAEDSYVWERAFSVFLGICAAGLCTAGIIAVVMTLPTGATLPWFDAVISCSLQLYTGTNLRALIYIRIVAGSHHFKLARILRVLVRPRWTIWIIYALIIVMTPDTLYRIKGENIQSLYESALLSRTGAASLMSMAVSLQRLEESAISGREIDSKYKRLILMLIAANAIAASCQLCGAVALYVLLFFHGNISNSLYQSIYLACIATQFLSPFIFCLAGIRRWFIEPMRDRIRLSSLTTIESSQRHEAT